MTYLTLAMGALLLASPYAVGQETARADALLLEVNGPIGPAVSDFIERGIDRTAADGSRAVILKMDTPGDSGDTILNSESQLFTPAASLVAWFLPLQLPARHLF